ncbi:MAG TPA: NAD-dependent deacylase [Rubrobacteraceae bacterium]|nr:NAD-dependent deacylase [Rubrobacteraceae bacterium]
MSSAGARDLPPALIVALRDARYVVALTGSGVSAESGVPTFREAQTGLWERYDPQQLATPEAFDRDPRLVWEWYEWRRNLVSEAEPNPGHLALAELERRTPNFTLVTQNVDGLHKRAGSQEVIELHGNILRSKCSREGVIAEPEELDENIPPRCPQCGANLRPDVVWFGEMLPPGTLDAASEAARACDLFLSVGTSSLVYPAAALPYEALENGATLVEINPSETPLTQYATFALQSRASEALPNFMREVCGPPTSR